MINYQQAWQFLDELQFFKIKLGLDSMRSFLESLGNPHSGLKFIHIGGTNGKGSTAASLLSILSEAGYKVGLYSSPHLSTVRERFRIGDQFISEDEFAENAQKIINVLGERQITYFEFTTTLSLLWFAQKKVDLAIMEVGMGGRLDATNVIEPIVSVITNVSMDHEAYLGNNLTAVSQEKAGIIKTGIPLVSGVKNDESGKVVGEKAEEVGAPLYLLGKDFQAALSENGGWQYQGIDQSVVYENLRSGLKGNHQIENASLAIAVVELLGKHGFKISPDDITAGLKKTKWPGRLEYIVLDRHSGEVLNDNSIVRENVDGEGRVVLRYLLDGAHNPAGIDTLKKELETIGPENSLIGVWASMADKDIKNSLLPIAHLFDKIILTRPEYERSAVPEKIKSILPENIAQNTVCTNSVSEAIKMAEKIAGSDDLICVAGSLYLIGKAREILMGEL